MRFEIGMQVIAIKDHSQGKFRKGDTFLVKDLTMCLCKCHTLLLDVGIFKGGTRNGCTKCDIYLPDRDTLFFSSDMFIPIQEDSFKEVTFSQIKEPAFCCAN
jgi:hypothetical protein